MQQQGHPRATRRTLVTALLLATVTAAVLTSCQRTQPTPPPTHTTYAAGDHLQYRPGVSGPLETITLPGPDGEPFTLTYEVIDGLAIVGGDMIIATAADLAELATANDTTVSPASAAIVERICAIPNFAICAIRFRWPDGIMPYTFANDWGIAGTGIDENAVMRARIREAMDLIEAVTAAHFVPRTNQRDYVEFTRGKGGCSAVVGRWGKRQHVYLANGCGLGATIHEILHALGMWHEHQRHDRDEYVVINWHNIEPDWWYAYEHHHLSFDIGPYDYDSIMHYNEGCKFDEETKLRVEPAIVTIPPGIPIGGRSELSSGDIQGINRLYPGLPPTITITRPKSGASYGRGATNIFFEAHVTDPEGMDAFVTWESHLDGRLGAGHTLTAFTGNMSYGPHIITARARDPQGNTATDAIVIEIRNDPPQVEILEPRPGSTFCSAEPILFRARVIDHNEPNGTIPDERIYWRVGMATPFATGRVATTSFNHAGTYEVIVRAVDELGLVGVDATTVRTVACTNQPPTVTITQPPTDITYWADTYDPARRGWFKTVNLIGHATDPEDGDLTGHALVWTTDQTNTQDPLLGTSRRITPRLYTYSESTRHTVTLTATDSAGNTRTALVRITIKVLH